MRRHPALRRGVSSVQWCLIAAFVILAVVGGAQLLGTNTSNKMNETATDLSDVSKFPARFGKSGGGS
jgi:Flp pilus assembly pilin Flp